MRPPPIDSSTDLSETGPADRDVPCPAQPLSPASGGGEWGPVPAQRPAEGPPSRLALEAHQSREGVGTEVTQGWGRGHPAHTTPAQGPRFKTPSCDSGGVAAWVSYFATVSSVLWTHRRTLGALTVPRQLVPPGEADGVGQPGQPGAAEPQCVCTRRGTWWEAGSVSGAGVELDPAFTAAPGDALRPRPHACSEAQQGLTLRLSHICEMNSNPAQQP